MVLSIQHLVRHALALEQFGQQLRLLNRDGAHQHGLTARIALLDLRNDGAIFSRLVLIHDVVHIHADDGLVGRDLDDVKAVDLVKFHLLGLRRTRHTR